MKYLSCLYLLILTACIGKNPAIAAAFEESYRLPEQSREDYVAVMNSLSEDDCIDPKEVIPVPTKEDCIKAYLKYLGNRSENYFSYSLINIDDDMIPEMLLQGGCEADGYLVLSIQDGKIIELQTERLHFSYIEGKGLCGYTNGSMGIYYTRIFSLQNNQFVEVIDYEWNEDEQTSSLNYKGQLTDSSLAYELIRKEYNSQGLVIDVKDIDGWIHILQQ